MTQQHSNLRIGLVVAAHVALTAFPANANWPTWRGTERNGLSTATGLPTTWSPTQNIAWSTPLPSWSGGSPVVWGDRVFLTSPSEPDYISLAVHELKEAAPGRQRDSRHPGGDELLLICVARSDGRELWRRALATGNQLRLKHNYTSPSPVTDGTHVWAATGTGVVAAFTVTGEPVWSRDLQADFGAFGLGFGYASSPLQHEDLLVLQVLHGRHTDDPSYLIAFNSSTGETQWRQERPTDALSESPDAYSTPTLLRLNGREQIVVSGADYVTGHDPATGAELWRRSGLNPDREGNYRVVGSPVVVADMIFAPTRKKPLLALRAQLSGSETQVDLLWQWTGAGAPDVPTPVSDGTYLYLVNDRGLATCLEAQSGERIWGPERTAQGIVSASPLIADGKLYIVNEDAVTTVLAAAPKFQHLATNLLDGSYTLSSPAVSGGQLFIRTGDQLFCIASD